MKLHPAVKCMLQQMQTQVPVATWAPMWDLGTLGYPYIFMGIHGSPWAMGIHGYPWICMDDNGYPLISINALGWFGINLGPDWTRFVHFGNLWGHHGIILVSVWDEHGFSLGSVWCHFAIGLLSLCHFGFTSVSVWYELGIDWETLVESVQASRKPRPDD